MTATSDELFAFHLGFVVRDLDGKLRMFNVRSGEFATIERSGWIVNPTFSPDGRSIAFFAPAGRAIRRVSIGGGAATTICAADRPFGMTWEGDDILFAQNTRGQRGVISFLLARPFVQPVYLQ